MDAAAGPDVSLPPLRQDLALHGGPDAPDGTPTWTLHDPARNRFFHLGWPAFELLSRWHLRSADAVLAAVRRETTLSLGREDLEAVLRLLAGNHLLLAAGAADTARLQAQAAAMRPSAAQWLLKNYLSLRVPLVRPMDWLRRWSPYVAWAFRPAFWVSVALAAVLGLVLAARHWDEFAHTFVSYANLEGVLAVALAMSFAKVLHELGHAFTATRYGCRVPSMGVAFLVMWPVLYTDTNEAWKLTSRRQRLAIGAAGMLSELALASLALVAWSLLPATPAWAPVRSGAFLLATTTWVLTLAINASPFMRFDGYFLLSDAVNMPNLHDRAFAMARWWLRERLFAWGDPAPEAMSVARRRWLVAFAFLTWLYRLVLFLGIALVVYHAFFRLLGAVLLAVELGWFIVRPIAGELAVWRRRWPDLRWNPATRRTALAAGVLLLLALWPWPATVRAPGVLGAAQAQGLYAPEAAQVASPPPRAGQRVHAGERLLTLRSPVLQHRLALARAQEQTLRWQLQQQPFDAQLREDGPALRKRWEAAVAEVAGLQQETARLELRAPFDGRIADVDEDAPLDAWVPGGELLLRVVGDRGAKADVFVGEDALADLRPGDEARFVPAATEQASVRCRLARIDAVQLAALDRPDLASVHGGPIAAERQADGRIVPRQPTFHLRLDDCDRATAPAMESEGVAVLDGARHSWVGRALRRALALWQREAAW
jgi:putative peptide zinc metalloprotease protein